MSSPLNSDYDVPVDDDAEPDDANVAHQASPDDVEQQDTP